MELIKCEKARRLAFEKRRKGLEKAANELSTLCGVDIGMIIYAPPHEPTIWPRDDREKVERMILSYKSRSGHEGKYGTYNLPSFFKDQTEKVQDEIKKLRKKTREAKYPAWDDRLNGLSQDELKALAGVLMAKIHAARERISLMKASRSTGMLVEFKPCVEESSRYYYDNRASCSQQQPFLGYYGNQSPNMGINPSCSQQGTYTFDQNRVLNYGFDPCVENFAYNFEENWVQNQGFGTGSMNANVGVSNFEPLRSYYVPNPEPLMSYYMPNEVQVPQNEQASASNQTQLAWDGGFQQQLWMRDFGWFQ